MPLCVSLEGKPVANANLDVLEQSFEERKVFRHRDAESRAARDEADRPSQLEGV